MQLIIKHTINIRRLILAVSFCITPLCLSATAYAEGYDASIDFPPVHELSLPVSGVIKALHVTSGQRLSKGDEMLALDPVPFDAARSYAKSRVTVQQTLLTESERDLQQQQELYDRTLLARVDLENAELRVKRDRALLENAQAQLANAEYELAYSKLISPFDALVTSVHVNQRQSINNSLQSKKLISLVEQGKYLAKFYVSADELGKFSIGQGATINSRSKDYPGKVSSIVYSAIDQTSNEEKPYLITAVFTTQDQRMPVGQRASVHID